MEGLRLFTIKRKRHSVSWGLVPSAEEGEGQSPPTVCQRLLGISHPGPHFVIVPDEVPEAHRDQPKVTHPENDRAQSQCQGW